MEAELCRPELHRKGNSYSDRRQGETHSEGRGDSGVLLSVLGAGSSLQEASLPLVHHHPPTLRV